MVELFTLSLIGSISTFFPIWRALKRTSSLSSVTECVVVPNVNEPNFQVSSALRLSDDEKKFYETILDKIQSNSELTVENPSLLSEGLLNQMQRMFNHSNFNVLAPHEQASLLIGYLRDQSREQASAIGSQIQKKFSSSSSADSDGGGSDIGLILWTISSCFFLAYIVWRIQQLKEDSKKTKTVEPSS